MARNVWNSGGSTNPPTHYEGLEVDPSHSGKQKHFFGSEGLEVAPSNSEKQKHLVGSDGLQAVPNEFDASKKPLPEVAVAYRDKQAASDPFQPGLEPYMQGTAPPATPKRNRRRLLYGVLAGVVVLILVIVAVVVAVVVTKNNSNKASSHGRAPNSSPSSSPGAAPANGNETSTGPGSITGVWNGTGMAAVMPRVNQDPVWLVSQRYTGEVQLSRLDSSGTWHAPQVLQLPSVMNGTFLEAISYVVSNEIFYHIFYIDTSGVIQNSIMTNQTNQWEPGTLGTMNWKAATNPMSKMKAWWHFSNFGKTHGVGGGIRLFAGADDGLLHEYSYDQASDSWAAGYTFQGVNGAGGNGITQNGNSTLLHLLNSQNQIELWWWNQLATNAYPVGAWVKGADSSASVLSNSDITLDGVVYYQDPSNAMNTVVWTGFEDTERWLPPNLVGGITPIAGTRMASLTFNVSAGDAPAVHVFCQTNASNIVSFVQNNNAGPATNLVSIPLP